VKTADFDYHLPEERIAQTPLEPRHAARLLVLDRARGAGAHHLLEYRRLSAPGDLLVVNQTRVIPARIFAAKTPAGGSSCCCCAAKTRSWEALVGGKGLHPGPPRWRWKAARALKSRPTWAVRAAGCASRAGGAYLDQAGQMPLPPYIHERLADPERYQTVYAASRARLPPHRRAALHPELIERLKGAGGRLRRGDPARRAGHLRPGDRR
jgi:S-adenosylmethionine:tRNA ribosyltransferase-isomerase